jgi:hypothetical protein
LIGDKWTEVEELSKGDARSEGEEGLRRVQQVVKLRADERESEQY